MLRRSLVAMAIVIGLFGASSFAAVPELIADTGPCINCEDFYGGPECVVSPNSAGYNCQSQFVCGLFHCWSECRVSPGPQNCDPGPPINPGGADFAATELGADGALTTLAIRRVCARYSEYRLSRSRDGASSFC